MNNFKFYLFILVLIPLITACQEAEPKPEPPSTPKQTREHVVEKPTPSSNSSYLKENYTQEDAYTKVFKDCFATGKIEMSRSCKTQLNSFLKQTQLSKKRNIIIEVYTDKEGSKEGNLQISQKRAYSVANSLYYKEYKYSKVFYHGFGEEKLLYDANTAEANRENRRLIVKVRDKKEKIDKKLYKLYSKKKPKKKSIKKSRPEKKVLLKEHLTKVDLTKYTGKADIGWIYFGKEILKEKFNISCVEDSPRRVKRKSIKGDTKEKFINGLYKTTFKTRVGKQTLVIAPVSVYDNGYLPKKNPNLLLTNPNQSKIVLQTTVNSYNGEKAILYRVFVDKAESSNSEMECMDLVLSLKTGELEYGIAYFKENNQLFSRELK